MSSTPEAAFPRTALRVNEACDALGISRTKLYAELASGRLTARKTGSVTLIPVASLNAWLNSLPEVVKAA